MYHASFSHVETVEIYSVSLKSTPQMEDINIPINHKHKVLKKSVEENFLLVNVMAKALGP